MLYCHSSHRLEDRSLRLRLEPRNGRDDEGRVRFGCGSDGVNRGLEETGLGKSKAIEKNREITSVAALISLSAMSHEYNHMEGLLLQPSERIIEVLTISQSSH